MPPPLPPIEQMAVPIPVARRSLPLFLRILAVALGAVFCAQAVNFAIILLVRLPQPQPYPLREIARVLRSGEGGSTYSVGLGEPPTERSQDPRDRQLRLALANSLNTSEAQLRVNVARPPSLLPDKPLDEYKPLRQRNDAKPGNDEPPARSEVIIGGFTAAIHLSDGQWRLVRPNSGFAESWQWQIVLWLLGTLLVATPLAWLAARRVAAPVRLFATAAERLGRDPSTPPLSGIDGPPEIAAAVDAFNEMQRRLKRYVDDRTIMVAAIAHDLRTPLMRLSLLLEAAPATVKTAGEREIKEMTTRIRGALAFAQELSRPANRQLVELRALLERIADEMTDRGDEVTVEPGEDVSIDADVAGVRSLFTNLVENAVRYGNRARLTLCRVNGEAIVEVADSGPGIPEKELEAVFAPFYRLETSRNRATGGSGLGLASARAVARAHGGEIRLINSPEGGLKAQISLPAASFKQIRFPNKHANGEIFAQLSQENTI